ncbi:TPA: NinE family protein [Enterobacter hormaechei]|nr:NinE family protein [Enterobacter hormaechei]HCD6001650.1 NinE family protein [Enterobacter hormaechei]HCD6609999.1 NinE family protein [Enterobacter hormaechei]HCR1092930.1 NinE family protein [Enterobacter hormaechei]
MASPLARVMSNHIFKVPVRNKRKPIVKPSDIPTFNYSAHLYDVRWLRLRARRKSA